jgi:hypothetical protein
MLDQDFIQENNPNTSIWPHAFRNGIIWGLLGIAIQLGMLFTGVLEQTMDGSANTSVTVFSSLVGVAIAVWCIYSAIKSFRDERGSLTFGNAVGVGAMTGLVYGLVSAVWTFIFFSFIFPDFYDTIQQTVLAQYEEAGMDEDQIEQAMTWVNMFSNPVISAISAIPGGAIYGTILSLIIGIFTKTD